MTLVRVLTKSDKAALEYAAAIVQEKIDKMDARLWVKNSELLMGNYPGDKSERARLTAIVNRLRAMAEK